MTATLNGQPLAQAAGPTVPFWGSDDVPGEQPGDFAGLPGKGFAKILEGRINGQGPTVRPVLFIDAEGVFSNTLIPSGATDTTTIEFQLPPGVPPGAKVAIEARLLYRRTFRALQVTKGWTQSAHGGPIETEVARQAADVTLERLRGRSPHGVAVEPGRAGAGARHPRRVPARSPELVTRETKDNKDCKDNKDDKDSRTREWYPISIFCPCCPYCPFCPCSPSSAFPAHGVPSRIE